MSLTEDDKRWISDFVDQKLEQLKTEMGSAKGKRSRRPAANRQKRPVEKLYSTSWTSTADLEETLAAMFQIPRDKIRSSELPSGSAKPGAGE